MKKRKQILLCISALLISSYVINVHAQERIIVTDDINNTKTYENTANEENESPEVTETIEEVKEVEEKTAEEIELEIKQQEVLEKQKQLQNIQDKREWFIAYKNLIEEYSEWFDPPETIYDYYTEDEIYLMQKCIETETFEADFESKVNVASVILNRLKDEEFSDSVYGVIIPDQFAFGRNDISDDTVLALEYAFMIGDTTNGALYFHSNTKTNTFNGAEYIFTDTVGHHFYK